MESFDITYEKFFGRKSECAELDHCLEAALRSSGSIGFVLQEQNVQLVAEGRTLPETKPMLIGHSKIPGGPASGECVETAVFLPLLINVSELHIPVRMLRTFGLAERPVADMFWRNLLMLTIEGQTIDCCSSPAPPPAGLQPRMRDLGLRYLWVFRSIFPESVLKSAHAAEMLLANCWLPVIQFESPLLNWAAESLRSDGMGKAEAEGGKSRVQRLLEIRSRVLANIR